MKRVLAVVTSLICVIGLLGCNDGNRLTLDRVVELSAKGEDLSWSDFEQYESKDVGSGLYIYFYDIVTPSVYGLAVFPATNPCT